MQNFTIRGQSLKKCRAGNEQKKALIFMREAASKSPRCRKSGCSVQTKLTDEQQNKEVIKFITHDYVAVRNTYF